MNLKEGTSLSLNPQSTKAFRGKFPTFQRPEELGVFSLDGDRHFLNDKSNVKFYKPFAPLTRHSLDLSHGYNRFIEKDGDINEKLDNILQWLLVNRQKIITEEGGGMRR